MVLVFDQAEYAEAESEAWETASERRRPQSFQVLPTTYHQGIYLVYAVSLDDVSLLQRRSHDTATIQSRRAKPQ